MASTMPGCAGIVTGSGSDLVERNACKWATSLQLGTSLQQPGGVLPRLGKMDKSGLKWFDVLEIFC